MSVYGRTDIECRRTEQVTGLERSVGAILVDKGGGAAPVSERQGWRLLATSIWVGGLPAALQSAEEVLPEGTRRINLEGRDRSFHP